MKKVIGKELISHLLLLERDQQAQVLSYIKDLLTKDEMTRRAEASEQAIALGKFKSFDQFDANFEHWQARKRASIK